MLPKNNILKKKMINCLIDYQQPSTYGQSIENRENKSVIKRFLDRDIEDAIIKRKEKREKFLKYACNKDNSISEKPGLIKNEDEEFERNIEQYRNENGCLIPSGEEYIEQLYVLNNDNDDLYQKFETSDYYIPLYEHFFDENARSAASCSSRTASRSCGRARG